MEERVLGGARVELDLVTEGMTTNNNGLSPTADEARNVLHEDGFTEDGTAKDVPDGTVQK